MKISQKQFEVKHEYLKSQIESYWLFEAHGENFASGFISVPPLGNPCIHFHLEKIEDFYSRENYNHKSIIIGQITAHIQLNPSNKLNLFVVNFKPYGLYNFLGITPPSKSENSFNSAEVFGKEKIEQIILDLSKSKNNEAKVQIIEDFLINNINPAKRQYNYLDSIIDIIVHENGLVNINGLIQNKCSIRTLQRYFAEVIGINPKTFTKILRHKYILNLIYQKPELKWNDLIFHGFYFDNSHFTKDFKDFSSLKPIEYLSQKNSIISEILK